MINRFKNSFENEAEKQYCTDFFTKIMGKNIIFTNSATTGILAYIRALELNPNDEVIIQEYAHPAMYNILKLLNIKIIFAKNNGLLIDINDVKTKITNNTKVIMYCEVNGYLDTSLIELREICNTKNILLFEDSAPSLGQMIDNKYAGSIGDGSVFSFSSTKLFYLGGGGVLHIKDDKIFEKAKRYIKITDYNDFQLGSISTYLPDIAFYKLKEYCLNFETLVNNRINLYNKYSEYINLYKTNSTKCYGAGTLLISDRTKLNKLIKSFNMFKIDYRVNVYPQFNNSDIKNIHIDIPFFTDLTDDNIKLISKVINNVLG